MSRDPYKLYPHDYVLRAVVLPLVPHFVKPNHITVVRMVLTPVVLYLLATNNLVYGVPLFIIASFTDMLDGSIARVRKQITPWGILFDPVADKLLIGLVALVFALRYFHPIVVITAVVFDLVPLAIWTLRARKDRGIMMANTWGKGKMVLQFLSITALLLAVTLQLDGLADVGEWLLVLATVFAAIATITYSL